MKMEGRLLVGDVPGQLNCQRQRLSFRSGPLTAKRCRTARKEGRHEKGRRQSAQRKRRIHNAPSGVTPPSHGMFSPFRQYQPWYQILPPLQSP